MDCTACDLGRDDGFSLVPGFSRRCGRSGARLCANRSQQTGGDTVVTFEVAREVRQLFVTQGECDLFDAQSRGELRIGLPQPHGAEPFANLYLIVLAEVPLQCSK